MVHANSSFSGHFEVLYLKLLSFLLTVSFCDFSLIFHVYFVANKVDYRFGSSFLLYIFDPPLNALKWFLGTHVIHNYRRLWVPYIRRYKRSKSFLTSCIPQLKSYGFVIEVHCFWNKIDSDCWLLVSCEIVEHKPVDNWCLAGWLVA